jgi:CheY-like chemotaxis protein
VLLDLNLPEVHGFDVLKWIRAHPIHTSLPVVVFTSSEREEDQARAKLLGASDFIKKPDASAGFREVARRLKEKWLKAATALQPSQLS